MTYEEILNRMLESVPVEIDKRKGSLIYSALSPAALELSKLYKEFEKLLNDSYADTAAGKSLNLRTAEIGISRKAATSAIRKGIFNISVPVASRFSIEDATYIVIESNGTEAILKCEQTGEIGNAYSGTMLPITYINGLTTCELATVISYGENEETDENLRDRYFSKVQMPGTSGNTNHYIQWALEVIGVGDAKVFPLWNGPGTVKLVIVNNNKQPATEALLTEVYEHIEAVRPIGATVTVVSGTAKIINTTARVVLAPGYTLQSVIDSFKGYVEGYFKSMAFVLNYVSHAKVGTILLGTDGVIDYSDLKLNGMASNILLADEEIPVIGTVELEV